MKWHRMSYGPRLGKRAMCNRRIKSRLLWPSSFHALPKSAQCKYCVSVWRYDYSESTRQACADDEQIAAVECALHGVAKVFAEELP